MPIYGYTCTECNNEADYLVKMSATEPPPCKVCGKVETQVKQLATGTAFLLKGYGWSKNGMNSKKVGNH